MSRWMRPDSCAVSSASAIGLRIRSVRPAHQAHRHEQPVVGLAGLVDRDDVRVLDAGLEQALAPEPLTERGVLPEIRGEELEGDGSVQGELRRLVDDAHSPLPEDALDAVAREGCALI